MQKLEKIHGKALTYKKPKINDRPEDFDITDRLFAEKDDVGKLVLRLTIGSLMLIHGIHKLIYGTEMVNKVLASVGLPSFFGMGVFLGEVIGPILVITGYKAKLGAFLIAMNMLIATLLVHSGDMATISSMGGWMVELNALYLFGSIAIIFFGAGKFALGKNDSMLD